MGFKDEIWTKLKMPYPSRDSSLTNQTLCLLVENIGQPIEFLFNSRSTAYRYQHNEKIDGLY